MITELGRRLGEQLAGIVGFQRRIRIIARARILEWIAAGLDLTLDVAGLAGNPRRIFELVIIGFDLGTGNAPVLQRHVVRYEILAVALLVFRADAQFMVGPAPSHAVPMHTGAANSFARQE